MNMTHDEMIDVIQAHREGKQIQFYSLCEGRWADVSFSSPDSFSFNTHKYRIKPEPKFIWVNEHSARAHSGYNMEQSARMQAEPDAVRVAVKYQEVIDDELE